MPERSYAHLKTRRSSWHVLARVTDSGWFARCGLALGNDYRAAMTLPAGEKTCESCETNTLRDLDREQAVDNAEVPT
jgi:hypothetical protein